MKGLGSFKGIYLCRALGGVGPRTMGETLVWVSQDSSTWSLSLRGPGDNLLSEPTTRWGYACATYRGGNIIASLSWSLLRYNRWKKVHLACSRKEQRQLKMKSKTLCKRSHFEYLFSLMMPFLAPVKGFHLSVKSLSWGWSIKSRVASRKFRILLTMELPSNWSGVARAGI